MQREGNRCHHLISRAAKSPVLERGRGEEWSPLTCVEFVRLSPTMWKMFIGQSQELLMHTELGPLEKHQPRFFSMVTRSRGIFASERAAVSTSKRRKSRWENGDFSQGQGR